MTSTWTREGLISTMTFERIGEMRYSFRAFRGTECLKGEVYEVSGHPGHAINCRCSALPIHDRTASLSTRSTAP